jgi:TonB family protein
MRKLSIIIGASLLVVFVIALQAARAQSPAEVQLLTRISQQPGDMTNYLELAKIYRAQRRYDEAEQLLLRALDLLRDERRTGQVQNPTAVVPTRPPTAADPAQTGQADFGPPTAPLRVGGTIKEPKKIRDVKPAYPFDAQANRVSGVVIIEAIIDRDGYVRDARVLRSVPMLDEAAVQAVRQWQYTPTLLNGYPVEVIMTVTVNFSLQ